MEKKHYFKKSYDNKERFISYWHQIDEIMELNPKEILEIGVGNKLVNWYLKKRNYKIISMDINEDLRPDLVGNVLKVPFCKKSFDLVACFEVLEHLPYKEFLYAMEELYRVAKSYVVISLPDSRRYLKLFCKIPHIGKLKFLHSFPKAKVPVHEYDGNHYWEIGKNIYPLEKIEQDIRKNGFKILKSYRAFLHPYHRFFVLKKG